MTEPTAETIAADLERVRADMWAVFDGLTDKNSEEARRLVNACLLVKRARKYVSGEMVHQEVG